ncbi:MAG: hypothetical protein ACTHMU_08635 [Thermomicrobiales bacterium]
MRSLANIWQWRHWRGFGLTALLVTVVVLATACSRPTPGIPRVWPGQALSPNTQVRQGDTLRLTIRATNDSTNTVTGTAGSIRTYTTYPAGLRLLDFTSSDVGVLAPDDQHRAWVQEVDTTNRVVVVSFGPVGPDQQKTVTLTFAVDAATGADLTFNTMLAWTNIAPDTFVCKDIDCTPPPELTGAALASDPQVQGFVADHPDEVQALLRTYQGGGGGLANNVAVAVGDSNETTTAPAVALLVGTQEQGGFRTTARAAFTPNEPVMLWYNLPDGRAVWIGRTDALDDGSLDWLLDTADWNAIPAAATSIVAHGQYSGVEARYLFNR